MFFSGPHLPLVSDPWIQEIIAHDEGREQCGLYLPTEHRGKKLITLENKSATPENSFLIIGDEIRMKLEGWYQTASSQELQSVILWHTHPGGLIGPSREDMALKIDGLYHLVITIVPGDRYGSIITFY